MITQSEIDELRMKILPPGGSSVVDIINHYRDQVTVTSIALEHVPLVIIAQHGMIARIPIGGTSRKLSQPDEIVQVLKAFFATKETLYLYINLPSFQIPSYVDELLFEVTELDDKKRRLREQIDLALDHQDKETFRSLSEILRNLEQHKEE